VSPVPQKYAARKLADELAIAVGGGPRAHPKVLETMTGAAFVTMRDSIPLAVIVVPQSEWDGPLASYEPRGSQR
jgi:hypothetical protein